MVSRVTLLHLGQNGTYQKIIIFKGLHIWLVGKGVFPESQKSYRFCKHIDRDSMLKHLTIPEKV